MSGLSHEEMTAAKAIANLNYTNPFKPERIELERIALGGDFEPEVQPFWSHSESITPQRRKNVISVTEKSKQLLQKLREKLISDRTTDKSDLDLYQDLASYVLFYELLSDWELPAGPRLAVRRETREVWKRFSREYDFWFQVPFFRRDAQRDKAHLFSMFHQIYRAFFNIFHCVIGQSHPAAELRSKIWESIFTFNMRRYRESLYQHLHQVTTLVMGPSGSGKELVARAIGLSQYIPFDISNSQFRADFTTSYSAINIAAFSSNLVESELFGHAKGAFTGAEAARAGWLESCGLFGSILLDEIGELELTTQVKLLRLLQNREFQRSGESKTRKFEGKLIAATNRDLRAEIQQKRFREDLYYRLCADVIETPSLSAQVRDNPEVLENLVAFLLQRIMPQVHQELSMEIVDWLKENLPVDYSWPGNIRELEQCVRNLMIHGSYQFDNRRLVDGMMSTGSIPSGLPPEVLSLAKGISQISLTADEVVSAYCRHAYRQIKSFEKVGKLLQLDRRTVRKKVDDVILQCDANEPK